MSIIEKVWSEVMGSPPNVPSLDKHMAAASPRSLLERGDSVGSPSPSMPREGEGITPFQLDGRRYSADMAAESQIIRPKITKSISIVPQSRPRLDSARSLPAHYGNVSASSLPSPASRKGENVWRSVFHPGSNKAGMDRVGAGRFDKATASEPSVYDWYNPLTF